MFALKFCPRRAVIWCTMECRRIAVATTVILLALAAPAAAQEPVPGPGEVVATFDCPDGSQVTGVVPEQATQEQLEEAMKAACPDSEFVEPAPPPSGDGPKVSVQTRSLLRQDLADLRANRFFIKVRCSRRCTAKTSVQAIVLDPRALPVGDGPTRKLEAKRMTRIPIRFKRRDRRIFKRASRVRLTGYVTATDAKGRSTTYTWERTCRLG